MSQTTTDIKSQMLSRLSHVDEVQYKRWNHYKVYDALNTRVTFRRHLDFFPLVPGFLQEGFCLGGGWSGGEVKVGETLPISLLILRENPTVLSTVLQSRRSGESVKVLFCSWITIKSELPVGTYMNHPGSISPHLVLQSWLINTVTNI